MIVAQPAGHGGLWIRIKHRFGPRMMEWLFSWIMTMWGAVLLLPTDTFASASWSFFREIGPSEQFFGTVMFVVGILRFIALIVNGARKDITPWIRVISAGCGFMIWFFISFCFGMSGVISVWIAVYPSFAFAEIINIIRAARDVGETSHGVP